MVAKLGVKDLAEGLNVNDLALALSLDLGLGAGSSDLAWVASTALVSSDLVVDSASFEGLVSCVSGLDLVDAGGDVAAVSSDLDSVLVAAAGFLVVFLFLATTAA